MSQYDAAEKFIKEYKREEKVISKPITKHNHSQNADILRDWQLYQLCQSLTKENRLLRKQNIELKKTLQSTRGEQFMLNYSNSQNEDYRAANYESYKKKIMQVMSSVKLLYGLYCQKVMIKDADKVLESMMEKIKSGNNNVIVELIRMFEQTIKKEDNQLWDIDQIAKECSDYQNKLLREHIAKMHSMLKDNIFQLKRDVYQAKQEIILNRDVIAKDVNYYCQKYLNFCKEPTQPFKKEKSFDSKQQKKPEGKQESKHESKQSCSSQISQSKSKKPCKKGKNQGDNVPKIQQNWDQIVNERAKLKQKKYLEPNIPEKLSESLSNEPTPLNYYSVPLNEKARPPKPPSKSRRYEYTIVDQLHESKHTTYSGATPKSRSSAKNQLKQLPIEVNCNRFTPHWKQPVTSSGRKYYR